MKSFEQIRTDHRRRQQTRQNATKRPSIAPHTEHGSPEFFGKNAIRLVSETAHDLRSPLAAVQAAVQLVQQGEMGSVNDDQEKMLSSVVDQCQCMDQMIGEMVQLERLRGGAPRANRQWIKLEDVRATVDQTLQPWAEPRKIDLLWDMAPEANSKVFADLALVRRLIVNLAVNAIRASRAGQCVLVRFSRSRDGERIECGIVDQGVGISEEELTRIGGGDRSTVAGEGLGLSICRQLAAVHFTNVKLRSRLGNGTEASFELPASGPHSVATTWVNWRMQTRGGFKRPGRRKGAELQNSDPAFRRIDGPLVSKSVMLSQSGTSPRFEDRVAVGTVSLGAAMSGEAAVGFGEVMANQMRLFDFAYQLDARRWIYVLDADEPNAAERIAMIEDEMVGKYGSVRATWSQPQIIRLGRQAAARMSDLMVRQSLTAATSGRIPDHNEVRLGTQPIRPSEIAALRLDKELRQLGRSFRKQAKTLKQQSQNLRPRM